jgi:hypothetical protein
MKFIKRIAITFFSVISFAFASDVIDSISAEINTGNSKNIDNIDLTVLDEEDIYSKQQAEMILKDFFNKHPVKSFIIAHKSAPKNGSQFVIGKLNTSNGNYRVYFLIKIINNKTQIQQFRIENENE